MIREPADQRHAAWPDHRVEPVGIWRLVPPEDSDDGTRAWIHVGTAPCHLRHTGRVWIATLGAADVMVKDRLLAGHRLFDVVGILGPGTPGQPRQIVCRELSWTDALEAERGLALSA